MMMQPLVWRWRDARILGMLHLDRMEARAPWRCAALVLSGGGQTRTGAGRALVALARQLASRGIPTLAMDWAGQGDSEGKAAPFDARMPQIAAARRVLARETGCEQHLLIGLCDAASSILLHAGDDRAAKPPRALVLVNCWMRDDDLSPPRGWLSAALRRRLGKPGALTRREPGSGPARLGDLARLLAAARRHRRPEEGGLEGRLRAAAARTSAPILWVVCRDDPTGRDAHLRLKGRSWRPLMKRGGRRLLVLPGDDHGLTDPRNRLALVSALEDLLAGVEAAVRRRGA